MSHYLKTELYSLIKTEDEIINFLQEGALDGMWYWDLENPEEEWMNRQFWETLGFDPTEMPHKAAAWQDIIDPNDLQLALTKFNEHAADASVPYDLVVRYTHKKGHTVWIRCRGLIIRDAENNPVRMLGAHTDISEQKKSEIELQNKLTKLNQIIEGTNLGTWEWDIKNKQITINDKCWQLMGYTPKENAPLSINEWNNYLHPEDKKTLTVKLLEHLKNKRTNVEHKMRLKHLTDGWIWTLCKGKVSDFDADNKAKFMTGYYQDITSSKLAEDKLSHYKELLDKTNEIARIGTWDVDLQQETVHWSNVTRQIHEAEPNYEPTIAAGIDFYKPGIDQEKISTVFGEALSHGKPFDEELRIITKKKNEKWIRTIGIPVKTGDKVTRIYGVFQDITELKESYLKREKLLKVMTEQNDRLTNFSSIVSHNLRSHTVNLSALIDLMDKRNPQINENEIYVMFKKATQNLNQTIQHLNEVAEATNSSEKALEKVKLQGYLQKAISAIKGSLLKVNGVIDTTVDPDLEVVAIPAYLDSVLLNLLTNAIKYRSNERQLAIKIKATKTDENVVISFKDNGLGIDLKKHGHQIFGMYKVFHQHKESRGIGLFITKGQVEAMKGTIKLESEVNKGTTFYIYLKHSLQTPAYDFA